MKKILLFILCLIVCVPYTPVKAENNNTYNIELVIDASGSLIQGSDVEGNRFTAIDIFLQTLSNQGHHVGAIVFNDNIILDEPLSAMMNQSDKFDLSKKVSKIASQGGTNIGLGLKTALQRIKEVENGNKSIILLMSDGNTDLAPETAMETSILQKKEAIEECMNENIPVYGICLNKDHSADVMEFKEITSKTQGSFLEVNSSQGLVKALRDFYSQIFQTNAKEEYGMTDEKGYLRKVIDVPDHGIEELNIIIDSASKIKRLSLTKPEGIALNSNEMKGISSIIGDYYFIKLTKPEGGTWILEVQGDPHVQIEFSYVYNSNYLVALYPKDNKTEYLKNEEIVLSASFVENNYKVTGTSNYQDYSGTLVVEDSQQEHYYPMAKTDEGFEVTLSYEDIGNYRAYAILNCGDFEIISNPFSFSIGNGVPTFVDEKIHIMKLFNQSSTIDLSKYFKDVEDETLSYTLISSSIDATLHQEELTLQELKDGTLTIQATDSHNASVVGHLQIKVTNVLAYLIGFVIFGAVGAVLMMIVKIHRGKNRMFEGVLCVNSASLEVNDSKSTPVDNFKGRIYLKDFCLEGCHLSQESYFEVIQDKTTLNLPKGNFSKKLRFVSPKEFYLVNGYEDIKVKSIELSMNREYVIRSISLDHDDSIVINLSE